MKTGSMLIPGLGLWLLMATGGGKALAAVDCGEPVPAPKLQVGEKWVSRNEKGAEGMREVVASEGDLAQIKWTSPAAEPDKEGVVFIDPEGVIRKAIRPNGEVVTKQGRGRPFDLIGQRELDFPLQVGKTWNFGYMSGSGDFGTRYYRVVACEEVSTTAGKFSALKIEAEIRVPRWSGTYHFWYAPKVKNNVKWKFPGGFGRTALDSELVQYEVK
jgi:hypothetical protein